MRKKKSGSVGQRIMERNLAKEVWASFSSVTYIVQYSYYIDIFLYISSRHNFDFHILIIFSKRRGGTLMGGEKERCQFFQKFVQKFCIIFIYIRLLQIWRKFKLVICINIYVYMDINLYIYKVEMTCKAIYLNM